MSGQERLSLKAIRVSPKCSWCGKKGENVIHEKLSFRGAAEEAFFCNLDHLEKTREFLKYAESHFWHFIMSIIVLPVIGMLITFTILENVGLLIIFGGLGLTIIVFPFATPQTNSLLGFKNAIRLIRIIGVALAGAGIILLLL
ncbi:MAG: hypothetical protein ACFFBS_04700 [Promethearchaeota archaeon]